MVTRLWAETAVALFTLAYGLVIVRGATEFGIGWDASGPEPGAFPFYTGLLVALASLGTLVVTWSKRLRADHGISAVVLDGEGLRRVISFFLPILGFVLLCATFGMYVATIAYLIFAMRVQGGFGWLRSLATAFGAAIAFYVILERIFLIQLMKGPLEALLGL
ncbi:tripartite tricarboxylate transporter TctB family protein [Bosea thiooxidans]